MPHKQTQVPLSLNTDGAVSSVYMSHSTGLDYRSLWPASQASLFFGSRSNFRAITRLETLATQAKVPVSSVLLIRN